MRVRAALLFGALAAATAVAPSDADACSYGGCPDWPSDCYNLKSTKWCPEDGVSTVTLTNHGSYESAFDWARGEISNPHNGITNSLVLKEVSSGGQIDVYNYTGSADWWGLADQYSTSGSCLKSARVQINKNYMSSTVRKQLTMLHELGHTVGLNHVCVCPRTMNPCGTCGDDANGNTPYLKKCDAQGLAKKYPGSDKPVSEADDELLYQAHLLGATTGSDIDGDGKSDVCGRGSTGVTCYLATDTGLGSTIEGPALSDDSGWNDPDNATTLRMLDMDGDGKADICARANAGVRCWKSTGKGFGATIEGPAFSDEGSWDNPVYFTTLRGADFNGDGKDDLCARSATDFRCYPSTGDGFGAAVIGPELSNEAGWNKIERYGTIQMGDIDGDGKADVCGRDATGMRCFISDGKGFPKEIAGPAWTDASGWNQPMHFTTIRLADVDGDGKADLCGRAAPGYSCYLSTGEGFELAMASSSMSNDDGWNDYDNYSTIRLADVDGDGDLDLCGRANSKFICKHWEGSDFGPMLGGPELSDPKGWDGPEYFRTLRLADVNGDRKADLCARAGAGFGCWLSDGTAFSEFTLGPEWSDDAGWKNPNYYATIRMAGVAAPAPNGMGNGARSSLPTGSLSGGVTGRSVSDGGVYGSCNIGHTKRTSRGALAFVVLLGLTARRRRRCAA